ncbi:MAG: FkbM family methyltransferase [Candidatus Delongbacteria bacterium]|nr:FkbM family methyltransferase [Candidatus Delongbacteria bacterium]
MKISIITPCRNAEAYISDTIESILLQKGPFEKEHIIVDGASTDRTPDIINQYQDKIRTRQCPVLCDQVTIKLISEHDEGMYDALVKGLKQASGDIVAYLNADDFYQPQAFSLITDLFGKLPQMKWLTGIPTFYNPQGLIVQNIWPVIYDNELIRQGVYNNRALPYIQQESVFFRKELLDTVDFNRLKQFNYAGDAYLWHCFSENTPLFIVSAVLSGHRMHTANLSRISHNHYCREMNSLVPPPKLSDEEYNYLMFLHYTWWKESISFKESMNNRYIPWDSDRHTWKTDHLDYRLDYRLPLSLEYVDYIHRQKPEFTRQYLEPLIIRRDDDSSPRRSNSSGRSMNEPSTAIQNQAATMTISAAMNPKLIYDLGMHTGQDTEFYLKKGFDVIAIEANPVLAGEQHQRFIKQIENGRLKILNLGIGPQNGRFTFYVNDYLSEWSSFDREIGIREGRYHEIEVEMVPLETIFRQYGIPYYLKIDIEGYDFMALQSTDNLSHKPRFISVENGQKPMLDYLVAQGYTHFKFINQQKVPQQQMLHPAREGLSIDHQFPLGASGLFGEETPGEWLNYDHILPQIEAYWNNPSRDAAIHGWYDLHAKREIDMKQFQVKFTPDPEEWIPSVSKTLRLSTYSDNENWKNGFSQTDPRVFFVVIDKNDPVPIKTGQTLRFRQNGNVKITKLYRMENPTYSTLFITVDRPLDPEAESIPNDIIIIEPEMEKSRKSRR